MTGTPSLSDPDFVKALLLKHVRAELRADALTGEPYAAVAGLNNLRDAICALAAPQEPRDGVP